MPSPRRLLIRFGGPPVGFLAAHAFRLARARVGAALCYHSLAERSGDPEREIVPAVGRREFSSQMRFVRSCYRVVRASELADAARTRRRGQRIPLAVTFDDDLPSHRELAVPLLAGARLPATFFLNGPGIEEEDIRALVEAGHEVGFHTREHPYLPDLDDAALARAMTDGREELARVAGRSVHEVIAYPYGGADERVAAAARSAGFRAGWTTDEGASYDGDLLLCGRVDPTPIGAGNLALRLARALIAAVRPRSSPRRSAPASVRAA